MQGFEAVMRAYLSLNDAEIPLLGSVRLFGLSTWQNMIHGYLLRKYCITKSLHHTKKSKTGIN